MQLFYCKKLFLLDCNSVNYETRKFELIIHWNPATIKIGAKTEKP